MNRTNEIIDDLDKVNQEQQRKTHKPDPFIQVHIGEIKVKALVDTGAQITAITQELYEEPTNRNVTMTTMLVKKFPVRGAFSDKGETIGMKTSFSFSIGEKNYVGNFYVVRRLPYKMILGIEFLTDHQARISCTKDRIEIILEKQKKCSRSCP